MIILIYIKISMHPGILFALLGVIILVIVLWVAYSVTAAYQQTLTITVPFQDTYRYVPTLDKENKFKIDYIEVTVTGSIKKKNDNFATIVPSSYIQNVIDKTIIQPNKNSLLIHEAHTFTVQENSLKRSPLPKTPTIENLSIIYFNKLEKLMPEIGAQLVSVTLVSAGIKVNHSRYKISHYTTPKK